MPTFRMTQGNAALSLTAMPHRMPPPAASLPQADDEQRTWLAAWLARLGITGTQLAREAGLNPSTVTRFLNATANEGHALTFKTVRKIEAAARRLAGEREQRPGLREEAVPYVAEGGDAIAAAVRALCGGRNACDPWQVANDNLVSLGIHRGDVLAVDLSATPAPGDIVCAQLYDPATGNARTVFRLFDPPFLLTGAIAAGQRRPVIVDNQQAMIRGVVIARFSPRFADRAA